jgi:prepilin-type N-terminal cleavage/methylation domain-containing protein
MKKRGFTLIEMIITLGISVVALIALVNIFLTFNSVYGYQQAFMAAAGSAGSAMNALEAAVLPADQVLASHSFSGTAYSSGATALVLELPAVDSAGNIVAGVKDYIAFYTSGTTLYRLTLAGAGSARVSGTKKLSTTLNSISFTYDNADFTKVTNVTADVQTQAQYKQQTVQGHLSEQLYLRNL